MLLHSNIIGEGNNIVVILHGLFGSGDNWKTYANKLKPEGFCIHLIDKEITVEVFIVMNSIMIFLSRT